MILIGEKDQIRIQEISENSDTIGVYNEVEGKKIGEFTDIKEAVKFGEDQFIEKYFGNKKELGRVFKKLK